MPMYEFTCQNCQKSFEELVFTTSDESEVRCPACQSRHVVKQLSAFAVGASDHGYGGADLGSCATGSCCPGGTCGI